MEHTPLIPTYTTTAIAKAIGKSVPYVSMVLNGKRTPTPKVALAIERVTNGYYQAEALCPLVAEIRGAA